MKSIQVSKYSFQAIKMKPIVAIILAVIAALFFFQICAAGTQKIESLSLSSTTKNNNCHNNNIRAIFNFGDSNSDSGSNTAAFGQVFPPYGSTFFGKPSGRESDGRLIIDFIAEKLKLPYLSAFLDSIGADFRHGANFAVSGSTIQPSNGKSYGAGFNPLSLNYQLSQFEQLTVRTAQCYEQAAKDKDVKCTLQLPKEEDLFDGLYTMDIGQNDIHYFLISMTEQQAKEKISSVIDQFAMAVKRLHKLGGRSFWIHNTGPIGCLPFFLVRFPPTPNNTDQTGCVKSYNELAQQFNTQLKQRVYELRHQLHNSTITYVDIYSVKYDLISNATRYGFGDPLGNCCGKIDGLGCEGNVTENGTIVYAKSCNNPSEYINWDGIHYTEAANKWVADRIVNGHYSDPHFAITQSACL